MFSLQDYAIFLASAFVLEGDLQLHTAGETLKLSDSRSRSIVVRSLVWSQCSTFVSFFISIHRKGQNMRLQNSRYVRNQLSLDDLVHLAVADELGKGVDLQNHRLLKVVQHNIEAEEFKLAADNNQDSPKRGTKR